MAEHRAVTLLRGLEWIYDAEWDARFCPKCHGWQDEDGHEKGCALRKLLDLYNLPVTSQTGKRPLLLGDYDIS